MQKKKKSSNSLFLRKKVQIRDISKKKVQIRDISNKSTFDSNKTTNFLLFIERTLLDAKKQKIAIYFRKKDSFDLLCVQGFIHKRFLP